MRDESTPAVGLARTAAYWVTLVVTAFNALSAVGGGIAVLLTDGLGMPQSALAGGPFSSFALPGLVLVIVVGGTQSLATGLLIARRESALLWTAVAGVGMLIWMFVEIMIIGGGAWLQVLYFSTGIIQTALVFALLGIIAWMPRTPLRTAHAARS